MESDCDHKALKPSTKMPGTVMNTAWAGYSACVLALLYGAMSFYWAAGGTLGLDTVGGQLEELGRARGPALISLVWATGVLKVLAGLLALALVRPWGRLLPRRVMLAASWGGAVLLTCYGGFMVAGQTLVVSGVIPASPTADWTALWWHLLLWDPWFLLWGLLLGLAAWHYTRESRRRI